MQLPDQITAESFRDIISQYGQNIRALEEAPISDAPELRTVNGGFVTTSVLDHHVISPDSTLRRNGDFRSRFPIVEVIFSWPDKKFRGEFCLQTSAANLIMLNENHVDEGYTTDPSRYHRLIINKITDSINLKFICPTQYLVLGPIESGQQTKHDVYTYVIPSAATRIYGNGKVTYATGQKMIIDYSSVQPILRPIANGCLGIRPGAAYAIFEGEHEALAQIGNTWISTPIRE